MSKCRAIVTVLVLGALTVSLPTASAGWAFTAAYHLPLSPDHEHNSTFHASLAFFNDTAGVNGSATNGTGANGTGNQTAGDRTVNVTACHLVIEPSTNSPHARTSVYNMTPDGSSNNFTITSGPWPPGNEFQYHFEANLSDGTVIVSNSSWHRTPVLIDILWHDSPDEAARLARDLDRPLMVLVYSDLDHGTRQLYDDVFNRSAVVSLSSDFVCLRVSNDSNPEFGLDNHVRRLPSILFFNATTGKERDRLEKPIGGPLLQAEMKYILGMGQRPPVPASSGPGYRPEAVALGAVLVGGPAALFIALRRRARSIH